VSIIGIDTSSVFRSLPGKGQATSYVIIFAITGLAKNKKFLTDLGSWGWGPFKALKDCR
jgi:hypothetical protein